MPVSSLSVKDYKILRAKLAKEEKRIWLGFPELCFYIRSLIAFFFFPFHSDRILAWHSTTQNKSTYPSSLAAVRGCHKPQSWASGMQAEVSHGSCWETSLKIWSEWTPCCLLDHGGWGPVSRGGEWCREESDPKDQGRTASPAWKAELWTHDLPPGVILWVCYITWQNGLGKCS